MDRQKMQLSKLQSADDYSIQVSNPFKPLADFPPLTYSQAAAPIQTQTPMPKIPNRNTPSNPQNCPYFSKIPVEHITLTRFNEAQEFHALQNILQRFFPPNCHWEPEDPRKTQKFYEFILVDSKSVDIVHTPHKTKVDFIAFSKCIINHVQHKEEWSSPFDIHKFSKPFNPPGYNYYDYQTAWTRMMFKRPFDHSWFFTFHHSFSKKFPIWFLEWWQMFGPVPEIIPPEAMMGLNYYVKNASGETYERPIKFFAEFKVPWIFCWQYRFSQYFTKPFPFSIVREFKVKWWSAYETKYCSKENVKSFLTTGSKIRWEKPDSKYSSPAGPSTPAKDSKNPGKAPKKEADSSTPAMSDKDIKIIQLLSESSPELAKQYIQRMSSASNSRDDDVESTGSSFDPMGGPCAQEYEFL